MLSALRCSQPWGPISLGWSEARQNSTVPVISLIFYDILNMLTCLVTVSMSCVCTVHEVTWLTFQKWRKKNLASHHKECRTESHCNNDNGLLSLLLSELVTAGDTWAWHPLLHSFCHNANQCTWVYRVFRVFGKNAWCSSSISSLFNLAAASLELRHHQVLNNAFSHHSVSHAVMLRSSCHCRRVWESLVSVAIRA